MKIKSKLRNEQTLVIQARMQLRDACEKRNKPRPKYWVDWAYSDRYSYRKYI